MKTALDCYSRGKQKESSAGDYMIGSYYSREQFICPECGEFVHLRRSKYSNYFAHHKRLDTSAECDRRVDGVSTESIYEKIGFQYIIFLLKNTFNSMWSDYLTKCNRFGTGGYSSLTIKPTALKI